MIHFVKPNDQLIKIIADNMRDADVNEVRSSHNHSPLEAINNGLGHSDFAVIAMNDDEPLMIVGMMRVDLITGTGVPWLLSSKNVLKFRKEILKYSIIILDEMLMKCPKLVNYVHADNKVSIRWLKWLGFIIEKPSQYGFKNEMFHRFHLTR